MIGENTTPYLYLAVRGGFREICVIKIRWADVVDPIKG
jgi:hypothetical protein